MSKYTAEQVEAEADCLPDAYEDQAAKLRDYAALLRERESAKAAVTDALKVVLLEHRLSEWTDEDGNPLPLIDHLSSGNTIKSGADEIDRIIDAVEEAVVPVLASARVPDGWQLFCTQCFASEESGSWEHTVHGDETRNHCTNCGGNNTGVHLPVNAINSIRQQASWIGKRYYPHEEDRELRDERTRLLALVRNFPGRSAKRVVPSQDWKVEQVLPRDRIVSTFVSSDDADGAMRKSNLPYITEDMLAAAPKPETKE